MNEIDPRLTRELLFMQLLLNLGYTDVRPVGGGRWAGLMQFMFTSAIILGNINDVHGYDDRWCYSDRTKALAALDAWDGQGEPKGWHRHPDTGRRVAEDGTEYVNQ